MNARAGARGEAAEESQLEERSDFTGRHRRHLGAHHSRHLVDVARCVAPLALLSFISSTSRVREYALYGYVYPCEYEYVPLHW